MNKTKKIQQIKKEIQFKCPSCETVFQLLETHHSIKSELGKGKCLNNCLDKWNQTLQDYHSKELMADLDKQEENDQENNEHDK